MRHVIKKKLTLAVGIHRKILLHMPVTSGWRSNLCHQLAQHMSC